MSTLPMFDTLQFSKILIHAGMPASQAEALAVAQLQVIEESMHRGLASKTDIENLDKKMDANINQLDKKIDEKVRHLENKIDQDIHRLENKMGQDIIALKIKWGKIFIALKIKWIKIFIDLKNSLKFLKENFPYYTG